jgi:hypothetical protein
VSQVLVGFTALVAIMIAVPVLLAWIGGRRRLRVGRQGGVVTLRMPRGHYAVLASLAVLPFAAFTAIVLGVAWAPESGSSRYLLAAFTGLAGAAAGGYLLALETRGCLRVDDAGFEKVGAVRRRRSAWGDVAKITFNPVNAWFFLTLKSGERVYVVEGLHGIADFAELALQRLPPAVLAACPDAAEALRQVAES